MLKSPVLDPARPAIARIFATPGLPLTLVLEEACTRAAGHPVTVTIKVTHREDRALRSVEAESLGVPDGTLGQYRIGQLRDGSDVLAYTGAWVRTGLLPPRAVAALAGDIPLGKILHDLGGRRDPDSEEVEILHSGRVRLRACMMIGDDVAAAVSELITPYAVALLAA